MKIFKELKKLGYKHYAECTIEELDDLPLNSEERIMEQALVLRWFREKHDLDYHIKKDWTDGVFYGYEAIIECVDGFIDVGTFNTYEEAQLACLIKLIEIVKKHLE